MRSTTASLYFSLSKRYSFVPLPSSVPNMLGGAPGWESCQPTPTRYISSEGVCHVTTFVHIDRACHCVRYDTGMGSSTQPTPSRIFCRFGDANRGQHDRTACLRHPRKGAT